MTGYSPLILLSGGMDSTTLLADSLTDPHEPQRVVHATAVFIDYGQRHIREHTSAVAVALTYGIELLSIDLRAFGRSVRSALTSTDMPIPHGHYTAETMSQTVVPNRNATMLSVAAGIAASRGHSVVRTAVHAGDHAIYPDCRPDFIEAIGYALNLGCGVGVSAPFLHLAKTDIARRGTQLGVPYQLTWSCYEGGDKHCGRCGTCVERAEAFYLAHIPDPTDYADPDYWLTAVTTTAP